VHHNKIIQAKRGEKKKKKKKKSKEERGKKRGVYEKPGPSVMRGEGLLFFTGGTLLGGGVGGFMEFRLGVFACSGSSVFEEGEDDTEELKKYTHCGQF